VHDLVVRGGIVVDGTGSPRRAADVAVADGRIVEIGEVAGAARRTIRADGRIVAPGFVDVHTHYDAQAFWDPDLTPSSLYGVTTAIAGNCGFSLAPLAPAAASYVAHMLARVEGMPVESLLAGLDFDWTTMRAYLARLEPSLGINLGVLAGHSTIRRVVMGEAATERAATDDEVAAMQAHLRESLAAGALGFSTSRGLAHRDWDGAPVPSRVADRHELLELAVTCRGFPGTSLELIPGDIADLSDDQVDLMVELSSTAGRPVNWNVLRVTAATAARAWRDLRAGRVARDHGATVVALTMPIPSRARFSFGTGFVLDALPGWAETMALPRPARLVALRDPARRRVLEAASTDAPTSLQALAQWGDHVIAEVAAPALRPATGRRVADLARERRVRPFDALLDLVCDDELRTTFSFGAGEPTTEDWRANVRVWRDGRAVIGASDAGAHLDFAATYDYPAYVLEHAVRRHRALSLEEAVQHLSEAPARLYGLRGRGTLRVGGHADLVVFDETTIASGTIETRADLPAGAGRLYSRPMGVHEVVVGGAVAVTGGEATHAGAGRVLRSGRDTTSPAR
jgi:N-acyl-D-aspartate/D-glutamate deacylase